jgi:transcriptional regulator with XRE-family HTH domain
MFANETMTKKRGAKMTAKGLEAFHQRLRQAIGNESESSFAQRADIAKSGLNRVLNGGTPTLGLLIAIANTAGVSIDWLASGKSLSLVKDIPVIGFAECGLRGWYNEVALSVRAHGLEELGPSAFAVIAIGDSMRPTGIEQGFLCYCNPKEKPAHLDAVYLKKKDGSASLKVYGGEEGGWMKLQGWLKPDSKGVQKPYVDRIKADHVVLIAPVIYIKRKL